MDLLLCVPHAGPHVGGKRSQSLFAVAGRPFIVCLSVCLPPSLPSLIGFSSPRKPGKEDRYKKPDREKDNG